MYDEQLNFVDEDETIKEEEVIRSPQEEEVAHRSGILARIPRAKHAIIPASKMKLNEALNPVETISKTWVKHYRDHWADCLVGVLIVLKKGRFYEIIDGRHRWLAAKERGLKHYRFDCLVFEGLSPEEEAAIFSYFNTFRRAIPPRERYYADLISGDPVVMSISRVLAELALEKEVGAFEAMRNVVRGGDSIDEGEQALRFALDTLNQAFPTEKNTSRFNARMIKGFGQFFLRYCEHPHFDVTDFPTRVARGRQTAEQIVGEAAKFGSDAGAAIYIERKWLPARHDSGRQKRLIAKDA